MAVLCDSPGCSNPLPDNGIKRGAKGYAFCAECKERHSYRVLLTQVYHEQPIKDVILAASGFKTAVGMGDYIGVSFVTIYHWIRRYFDCTFQEFRRTYICKKRGESCYLLDIARSSYSRHDYVLKKIRAKRYCACINALDDNLIMTNAPVRIVQSLLRGMPHIDQISDDLFALVPTPVYFRGIKTPIYFDVHSRIAARAKRKPGPPPKKVSRRKVMCRERLNFRKRVFVTLHRLGGRVEVARLVEHLRTDGGSIPRKNNTRREVYRNPGLMEFDPDDNQVMRLTDKGIEEAKAILADL